MKAKSIKGHSTQEIEIELSKAITDGFKPTLGIVFLSIKQSRDEISALLDKNKIAVYGATTNGEFIDENYEQGSIAILLLDINSNHFFIQFSELNGEDDRKICSSLAAEALKKYDNPAFVITGSNLETEAEELLAGFTDVAGSDANIVGGMAGDDHSFHKQYVFTSGKSGDRAVLTLVLDQNKVVVKGKASHGWKAVGTEKTITKSEGNRVYTIDGSPALDVCLKYSGLEIDHPKLAFELVTNFPLQLQRENNVPLMRPAFHIFWEDHSMLTSGKLTEGSKIRFSLPPDFDVIEKVIDENRKMKQEEVPDADALIIYNCGGRLMSFGPLISEEIRGMKAVWNVPMAGMFSNAEFGRINNGKAEMHNLTTAWVALKEK